MGVLVHLETRVDQPSFFIHIIEWYYVFKLRHLFMILSRKL